MLLSVRHSKVEPTMKVKWRNGFPVRISAKSNVVMETMKTSQLKKSLPTESQDKLTADPNKQLLTTANKP